MTENKVIVFNHKKGEVMNWLSGKLLLVIIVCLVVLQFVAQLSIWAILISFIAGLSAVGMYLEFKNGG
jgi:hypothetical protein